MKAPANQLGANGILCPRCGVPMSGIQTKTAIWQGERVAIVEDIPAQVCGNCGELCYDGPVSDALRRLVEDGFPLHAAKGQITVPVFSLEGRIRRRALRPEDVHVD